MYQLLLLVHIVCAVVWVGGAVYTQILAVLAARSTDPTELPRLARHFEVIGSRVFVPAAVVLLVAGAAMTVQAWSFGQAWIALSVGLWVLSAVAGAIYLGPRAKRVADLFDTEGPASVEGRDLLDRVFLVSRLELVSFAVIIVLMV
ncbi:MAG TPA: DUF2269 family protein, partial [Candidatus Limnocylindria bacterium]